MYKSRGFNVNVYHRENEFNINDLREHIRPESLNIYAQVQHIPIIEKFIQTTKQGVRCTTHYMIYKIYTRLITRSLVECIIHSENIFIEIQHQKKLVANKILLGNKSPGFNMQIFFILRHGIYRDKKQHEAQKHTYNRIKRINQILRTFLHVAIHLKRDPQ